MIYNICCDCNYYSSSLCRGFVVGVFLAFWRGIRRFVWLELVCEAGSGGEEVRKVMVEGDGVGFIL